MKKVRKVKKEELYNFRVSKEDKKKIEYIRKNTDLNLPKMLRLYINEIYKDITDKDIDDEIYR